MNSAPSGPTSAASRARARVRELLHGLHGPHPPTTLVDDVMLVVSELVTNAERHGGGLVAFDACLADDAIVISVTDASPELPRTTPRERSAAPGGFGWPLIQRLGRKVDVTRGEHGKTIRVAMSTGHPAAEPR
ncbi:ATP-binding protein [Streptodolium elevatio]|uniref:ATP-binding protein n=1 Tax=Streptodolium elevatio TaxID=3157996 RepID=A0ABV3DP87_9ACTN